MKKIKLLIMDVDGTLTDGKIYISNSGEEMKAFNVKDGYAIKEILPKIGITPVIITGRKSRIVEIRAKELDIQEIHQGIKDKLKVYEKLKEKYAVENENIAYIGDDFNDFLLLKRSNYTACPQDAIKKVKEICDFISDRKGGEGAVHEFILELYYQMKEEEFIIQEEKSNY